MHAPHPRAFEFGVYRLDLDNRLLLRGSESLRLTPKAFDTLAILVGHRGQLVSKDDLIQALWPDAHVEENNLAQYISLLRRTLADGVNGQNYIETVPKIGYRFVAVVRELARAIEPAPERVPASVSTEASRDERPNPPSSPPVVPRPTPVARWRIAGVVLAVSVVTLVLTLGSRLVGPKPVATVAVLAPDAVPGEAVPTALRLTLAADLIDELGRAGEGRVLPLASGYRFVATAAAPSDAGQQLHADAVLTGQIERLDAAGVRATFSLTRTADGFVAWTDEVDFALAEPAAGERRVAAAVTRALGWNPKPSRPVLEPTFEAREAYVMGRYLWSKRSGEDLFQTITILEQAVATFPDDARLHAALAEAYAFDLGRWRKVAAEAAVASHLDPTLGAPHAALGFVRLFWLHDWLGATQELATAIRLSPTDATAHQWLAADLASRSDLGGATSEISEAHRLDPYSAPILADQCQIAYFTRNYDRGLSACREALAVDPDLLSAHVAELAIYEQTGQGAAAVDEYARICAITGRGPCAVSAPDLDELRRSFSQGGLPAFWRAELRALAAGEASGLRQARDFARLGAADAALGQLARIGGEGDFDALFVWPDPVFDGLRADPRFMAIFTRLWSPRLNLKASPAPPDHQ